VNTSQSNKAESDSQPLNPKPSAPHTDDETQIAVAQTVCEQSSGNDYSTAESSEETTVVKSPSDIKAQAQTASEQSGKSEGGKQSATELTKYIEELDGLIAELKEAVEAGQLKQCISLYERCQAKISQLSDLGCPAKKISKSQRALTNCYHKIRVLKDWRHWGTGLVRQDLIDELIKLQDYKGSPTQLASQLKQIRQRWNNWNRTGDFPKKKLRNKFEKAYETAFAPCRTYFQEQKTLRKQNKKIRKKICLELEERFHAINWNNPDWKEISDLIRESRQQWKKAIPLNKKDWNSTNSQFDEVISLYKPHLEIERQRGVRFRLDLIEKVKQQDSQSVHVAIKNVIGYQKDWKKAAIRDKKSTEKQLWEQFKTACDEQFERRKQENRKRQIPIDAKKKLLAQIKQVNETSDGNFEELAIRVNQITREWKDSSAGGRRGHESLDRNFSSEVEKFQRNKQNAKKRQFRSQLQALINKAGVCDGIEALAGTKQYKTKLASCNRKWSSIKEDCGQFDADIQHRYELACSQLAGDDDNPADHETVHLENLNTKQEICLELEILFEIESPPQYAQARLQRNVERLNEAFRKSVDSDVEKDIHDLLAKYCLTGPVSQSERTELADRFENILTHYLNRS